VEKPVNFPQKNYVTIGTFNLEWLGDGYNDRKPRSEADYKLYAEIIQKMDVDVLGVQEVENPNALFRILKYLPGYSFFLSREGGPQKVGVIFRKNVSVKFLGEYMPVEVEKGKTKPGLVIEAKYGNFNWSMMIVHLKSSSHFDDTREKQDRSFELRKEQAEAMDHWADSLLKIPKDQDLIIVGDFNDTPLRKKNNTLFPLHDDPALTFLTESLKSCRYPSAYLIDQVLVSQSARGHVLPQSQHVWDTYSTYSNEQLKGLSDHCPVLVNFDVTGTYAKN
jgi:exonuclease III